MESAKEAIALAAARMVVEEGLEYGAAKRQAARSLGLSGKAVWPDNDALEQAVEEYLALFCADTQPAELQALRALALVWMERLAPFRPHLGGAVWRGTATRLSDIYLALFCDDSKQAEIALIDAGLRFSVASVTGFRGETVDALSLQVACPALAAHVGVHLLVYDWDDLRGAMKVDARGKKPFGDALALRNLLHDSAYD